MHVKFDLLHPNAKLPARGHSIDVGLDTYTPEAGILRPGINKINLGFACHVPIGYGAFIYPRTGMASGLATLGMEIQVVRSMPEGGKVYVKDMKPDGISIIAHMPPIDPGYTGAVHALVTNNSEYFIKYDAHTRFGQLVFYPITYVIPVENVDASRGTNAFGSTGIGG